MYKKLIPKKYTTEKQDLVSAIVIKANLIKKYMHALIACFTCN